ncbi:MAG: histidine kinase [Trueperella sp.]|nr:histidine kinase [Trueperella sp.]
MLSEIFPQILGLTNRLDRNAIFRLLAANSVELTGASFATVELLENTGKRETVLSFPANNPANLTIPDCIADIEVLIADSRYNNELQLAPGATTKCGVTNYLACGIGAGNTAFARIYLGNKPGGFTAEDAVKIDYLAQAAAVAISNAELYSESQSNARWLHATQKIFSSFLHGEEEDTSLQTIASEIRRAARARTALIVLPSLEEKWLSEIVDGEDTHDLLGIPFTPASVAQVVTRTRTGQIVEDIGMLPQLRITPLARFGPSIIVPLVSRDKIHGAIILLRQKGDPTFRLYDLNSAEDAALQAAMAMELAEAKKLLETAAELEERARISRDLHDLALQQLFASGMGIAALKDELGDADPRTIAALDAAIDHLDSSAQQIRQIVRELRGEETEGILVDRLSRETAVAMQLLGFAPSLVITWRGEALRSDTASELDTVIGSAVADDIIAVVRETLSNTARHARASSCSVTMDATDYQVLVEINDDGVGIPTAPLRRSGLANLAARAQRHGGNFSIAPHTDAPGTCVMWQVPLR